MPAPKGHKAYPGCENGGRPRRYSQADIESLADEFISWLKDPSHIWFKDFCLDKDLDPDLMSTWATENEKFAGIYKLAKHRQESRLINGGLVNSYNSTIVKLVLSNAHGWTTEKQQTQLSGNNQNPLQFLMTKADGDSKELVNEQKRS